MRAGTIFRTLQCALATSEIMSKNHIYIHTQKTSRYKSAENSTSIVSTEPSVAYNSLIIEIKYAFGFGHRYIQNNYKNVSNKMCTGI